MSRQDEFAWTMIGPFETDFPDFPPVDDLPMWGVSALNSEGGRVTVAWFRFEEDATAFRNISNDAWRSDVEVQRSVTDGGKG